MSNIVGVKFRKPGKIYFFDAGELNIEKNQNVIVETSINLPALISKSIQYGFK